MLRWRAGTAVGLAVVIAAVSARAGSVQADAAEDARGRVALMTSGFASGRTDRGAGFVIGYRGDSVLIATAAHVVLDQNDTPAVSVDVSFPWDRRTYSRVTLIERNRDVDVAVLWLEVPEAAREIAELPILCLRDPRADEAIVTIGHRLDETWVINRADQVLRLNLASDTRRFVVSSRGIERGNSGGPALGQDGCVLGLVTNRDAGESHVTRIHQVLALLPGDVTANLMGGESSSGQARRAEAFADVDRVLNKYLFDLEALPALFRRSKLEAEEIRRTIEDYNASYASVYHGRASMAARLGEHFGGRRGTEYSALVAQIDAAHKSSVYIKLNDAVTLLRTAGRLSRRQNDELKKALGELEQQIAPLRSSVDAYLAVLQPLVKHLISEK